MLSAFRYCLSSARSNPNAWYNRPSGSLNRGTSRSPYGLKNHWAFSSVPKCTNASGVPWASISRRRLEISSTASRQNVQPKCRKNTRSNGRAAISARGCPFCDVYAPSKSASMRFDRKIAGASSGMAPPSTHHNLARRIPTYVPFDAVDERSNRVKSDEIGSRKSRD